MLKSALAVAIALACVVAPDLAQAEAAPATAATPAVPAWVQRSDAHSQVLLDVLAKFAPEQAGSFGVSGLDQEIVDLKLDVRQRFRAALAAARQELSQRRAAERDPKVQQDLDILLKAGADFVRDDELQEKHLLPYYDVSRTVFFGLSSLLDDQVAAERRPAALVRLRRYTGLESGYTPLVELAKAQTEAKLAQTALLGPYHEELTQSLENTPRFVAGIKELFAKYQIEGADEALAALEAQLGEYDAWLREKLQPRARKDHKLPAELYAFNLQQVGLDIAPEVLIGNAQLAYAEIRREMQALTPLLAKEKGIKATDYRELMRALKAKQIAADKIEKFYAGKIATVEDLIREHKVVTLPARPMLMRLATEAESARQPAPYMDPPRMIGNTGERGTFVLPLSNPAAAEKGEVYDDFTNEVVAWTLTVHEGRPGHELQFSAMVENGVSLARSLFAFNSVNVEGWALYAEAEMKPYEPLEGQFGALQLRLLRAARAFLDPMLNLGLMDKETARRVLIEEVVVSPAMAQQEVDRYTFRSPGQATAYFYGYSRLMQLRTEVEILLGDKFDRHAFHDFILAQGLLPPELLRRAVLEEFVPKYR